MYDAYMPKEFQELLSDAGLTPKAMRFAIQQLTGEKITRQRTSHWWIGKTDPGPIVRAFLILFARMPEPERKKLLPPSLPD